MFTDEQLNVYADRLQTGLSQIPEFRPAMMNTSSLLRSSLCGPASVALQAVLQLEGYAAELQISNPELPYDPGFRHVYVRVGGRSGTVVDPTWSQLFSHVGIWLSDVVAVDTGLTDVPRIITVTETYRRTRAYDIASQLVRARGLPQAKRYGGMRAYPLAHIARHLERLWSPHYSQPFQPADFWRDRIAGIHWQ